jgi:hypothetical protein
VACADAAALVALLLAGPHRYPRRHVGAEEFRKTMSAIHVGGTFKITGENRHPEADALLLNNVDVRGARIVDIGASDGSTAVDLIPKLNGLKSYVIADLFLRLTVVRAWRHSFFDKDEQCILVAGPRCIAWPGLSKAVHGLYWPLISLARRQPGPRQEVLLVNPSMRALMASDKRISYREHSVFEKWAGEPPDVIKVANLLRRLYFPDDTIRAALRAVLESLPDGGHLLIVDNPRLNGVDPRAGLYRRRGDHFEVVDRTPNTPEIDDLIVTTRSSDPSAHRSITRSRFDSLAR